MSNINKKFQNFYDIAELNNPYHENTAACPSKVAVLYSGHHLGKRGIKTLAIFGLFCFLLVISTACSGESSSNTTKKTESSITVKDGKPECSGSDSSSVSSSVTINGQVLKCENGQVVSNPAQ